MAKTKISEFSATPANNTDIDSINISEGCAPSGINDAIRELMAQLKDFQTGAVGDSFNGPIGTSTAAAGAFTTLSATGAITSTLATGTAPLVIASTTKVANLNVDLLDGADWAAPAALGSTTPAAVSATTLSASSTVTLSGGTANGVAYLNGSKVVTSGSALTFDGTKFAINGATSGSQLAVKGTGAFVGFDTGAANDGRLEFAYNGTKIFEQEMTSASLMTLKAVTGVSLSFGANGTEGMRLTSTGLGIGTSSPTQKLSLQGSSTTYALAETTGTGTSSGFRMKAGASADYTLFTTQGVNQFAIYDNVAGAERLTLSSSGNLGLGVTPSAWGGATGNRAIEVGFAGSALWANAANNTIVTSNAYFNGTAWKYGATTTASIYQQDAGKHIWYNAPSGTAGTSITLTQAMTLDASGELGIGNTSPAVKLDVVGGNVYDGNFYLTAQFRNQVAAAEKGILLGYNNADTSSIIAPAYASGSGALAFWTQNGSTWGERARIDSSGNFFVGATASGGQNGFAVLKGGSGIETSIEIAHNYGTASGVKYADFLYATGAIGSITQNGTTAVAYNTSSDYRLKENIAPMTGALAKVALLKPCTYTWKAAPEEVGEGFIAHELAEVVPNAVSGKKDAVDADGKPQYQGIDTSFLVATLTAALQEAHGLIKSLEARVVALEAK